MPLPLGPSLTPPRISKPWKSIHSLYMPSLLSPRRPYHCFILLLSWMMLKTWMVTRYTLLLIWAFSSLLKKRVCRWYISRLVGIILSPFKCVYRWNISEIRCLHKSWFPASCYFLVRSRWLGCPCLKPSKIISLKTHKSVFHKKFHQFFIFLNQIRL